MRLFTDRVLHILGGKAASPEVLRILRREDPNRDLTLDWHYWSGSEVQMLEVLELYKEKVNSYFHNFLEIK